MSDRIEELKAKLKRVIQLLEDPHPGLFTWQDAFQRTMKDAAEFWWGAPLKNESVEKAVAAEREACAREVEEMRDGNELDSRGDGSFIAAAIRKRGKSRVATHLTPPVGDGLTDDTAAVQALWDKKG